MKNYNEIKIKAGYLLVVETDGEKHNMTVVPGNTSLIPAPFSEEEHGLACVTPGKHWWPLERFDENGEHLGSKVVAIYGTTDPKFLLDNTLERRELLWERKEVKKMTVAEICKELGYDIEIIK